MSGAERQPDVVLDWDGTCVTATWPAMGEWRTGAIENIKRLHRAGCNLWVFSARLNPFEYMTRYTILRDPAHVQAETQQIRHMLDEAGLTFVDIYDKPGKPSGDVYIDDKAERIGQGAKSWKKVTDRVLMRLEREDDDTTADD